MSPILKKAAKENKELLVTLAIILVALLGLWPVSHWAERRALAQLQEQSSQVLSLITEAMRGTLIKHESTPPLLARNPALLRSIDGNATAADIRLVNEELQTFAEQTGALDIYLLNAIGSTVAASNWAKPHSFVGHNFSYRPYFRQAIKGSAGRYFALGTTSHERGYYFAYPIRSGGVVSGVAVTKVDVKAMENAWRAIADYVIRVVDGDGVIFLSSRPEWVLRTLGPLTAEARARIADERRYDGQRLVPLASTSRHVEGIGDIVTVSEEGKRRTGGDAKTRYLALSAAMASEGWTVEVLAHVDGVEGYVNWARALYLISLAALSLGGLNIMLRRRRFKDYLALQMAARAELEVRVVERTRELQDANRRLSAEVDERRRAEAELLRTQSELVHAGKLAALGQMSAGLSHELNQPIAAIRSYAENAKVFLDRGQPDTARGNLAAIVELTLRMARIIRQLRMFARKEPLTAEPTSATRAIQEAVSLIGNRIDGIALKLDLPQGDVMVVGGHVRLQQVFVNLLNNAIDAVKSSPRREIHVRLERVGQSVLIEVRDTGTGVAEKDLANVFDPFFTTKPVGEGLGLGLSITYGIINQFGGGIEVRNHEDGGAVFTVRLRAAETAVEAVA